MFSKREWIIFATGAQAFHTLSHILITFTGTLPIYIYTIEWTQQLNYGGILINSAITFALFKWAQATRR